MALKWKQKQIETKKSKEKIHRSTYDVCCRIEKRNNQSNRPNQAKRLWWLRSKKETHFKFTLAQAVAESCSAHDNNDQGSKQSVHSSFFRQSWRTDQDAMRPAVLPKKYAQSCVCLFFLWSNAWRRSDFLLLCSRRKKEVALFHFRLLSHTQHLHFSDNFLFWQSSVRIALSSARAKAADRRLRPLTIIKPEHFRHLRIRSTTLDVWQSKYKCCIEFALTSCYEQQLDKINGARQQLNDDDNDQGELDWMRWLTRWVESWKHLVGNFYFYFLLLSK